MVPTVLLGFLLEVFCSIEIAGDNPSMLSTSGLLIKPKNCLAYADKDSTYLLWPSAYIVSKAKVDLPDPDKPVITINLSLGISKFIFFKLCSLAPLIRILFNLLPH